MPGEIRARVMTAEFSLRALSRSETAQAFVEPYKDTEALWEILSPNRSCSTISFKRLAQLYADGV